MLNSKTYLRFYKSSFRRNLNIFWPWFFISRLSSLVIKSINTFKNIKRLKMFAFHIIIFWLILYLTLCIVKCQGYWWNTGPNIRPFILSLILSLYFDSHSVSILSLIPSLYFVSHSLPLFCLSFPPFILSLIPSLHGRSRFDREFGHLYDFFKEVNVHIHVVSECLWVNQNSCYNTLT